MRIRRPVNSAPRPRLAVYSWPLLGFKIMACSILPSTSHVNTMLYKGRLLRKLSSPSKGLMLQTVPDGASGSWRPVSRPAKLSLLKCLRILKMTCFSVPMAQSAMNLLISWSVARSKSKRSTACTSSSPASRSTRRARFTMGCIWIKHTQL